MAAIDHFGRKKLMGVGSIGYILSLSSTAFAFHTDMAGAVILVSLIIFIAVYAFGQGAGIRVFIGEVFQNMVRAWGQVLDSFVHWIIAAVISLTFPMIAEVSGSTFSHFTPARIVGQLIWVLTVMPETKGISLGKLEKRLGIYSVIAQATDDSPERVRSYLARCRQ